MVEIMYKYFDVDLSESHHTKLYICTLDRPKFQELQDVPNMEVRSECTGMLRLVIVSSPPRGLRSGSWM